MIEEIIGKQLTFLSSDKYKIRETIPYWLTKNPFYENNIYKYLSLIFKFVFSSYKSSNIYLLLCCCISELITIFSTFALNLKNTEFKEITELVT